MCAPEPACEPPPLSALANVLAEPPLQALSKLASLRGVANPSRASSYCSGSEVTGSDVGVPPGATPAAETPREPRGAAEAAAPLGGGTRSDGMLLGSGGISACADGGFQGAACRQGSRGGASDATAAAARAGASRSFTCSSVARRTRAASTVAGVAPTARSELGLPMRAAAAAPAAAADAKPLPAGPWSVIWRASALPHLHVVKSTKQHECCAEGECVGMGETFAWPPGTQCQ